VYPPRRDRIGDGRQLSPGVTRSSGSAQAAQRVRVRSLQNHERRWRERKCIAGMRGAAIKLAGVLMRMGCDPRTGASEPATQPSRGLTLGDCLADAGGRSRHSRGPFISARSEIMAKLALDCDQDRTGQGGAGTTVWSSRPTRPGAAVCPSAESSATETLGGARCCRPVAKKIAAASGNPRGIERLLDRWTPRNAP